MKTIFTLGGIGYTQGHGERFPNLQLCTDLVFFETREDAEKYKELNKSNARIVELSLGDITQPTEHKSGYEFYAQFEEPTTPLTEEEIGQNRIRDERQKGMTIVEVIQDDMDMEFFSKLSKYLNTENESISSSI